MRLADQVGETRTPADLTEADDADSCRTGQLAGFRRDREQGIRGDDGNCFRVGELRRHLTVRAIGEGDVVGGCVVERSEEVIEYAAIRYFDVGKGTAEHWCSPSCCG